MRPLQAIAEASAAVNRITIIELFSERRKQNLVHARQEAMYTCRILTGYSFPRIGQFFKKDHTTVMHGIKNVKNRIKAEPTLRIHLKKIEQLSLLNLSITVTETTELVDKTLEIVREQILQAAKDRPIEILNCFISLIKLHKLS